MVVPGTGAEPITSSCAPSTVARIRSSSVGAAVVVVATTVVVVAIVMSGAAEVVVVVKVVLSLGASLACRETSQSLRSQ